MRISLIVLNYVNLVEKKHKLLKGHQKKEKCIELIKKEIGIDRYNELSVIIDEFIEIYIGISKGYRTLDINKDRYCFRLF
jgi:hypothetical protein